MLRLLWKYEGKNNKYEFFNPEFPKCDFIVFLVLTNGEVGSFTVRDYNENVIGETVALGI